MMVESKLNKGVMDTPIYIFARSIHATASDCFARFATEITAANLVWCSITPGMPGRKAFYIISSR